MGYVEPQAVAGDPRYGSLHLHVLLGRSIGRARHDGECRDERWRSSSRMSLLLTLP